MQTVALAAYFFQVIGVQLEHRLVVHHATEYEVPHPAKTLREHVLEAQFRRRGGAPPLPAEAEVVLAELLVRKKF